MPGIGLPKTAARMAASTGSCPPSELASAASADAVGSCFYIDPQTGDLLELSDRADRGYRWAFYALHDLDFGFLLHHRPAWDITVWLLLAAGMTVAASSIAIGWARLRR